MASGENIRVAWLITTDDDETLVNIARELRQRNIAILDAYTPFPVEELMEVLEVPESRLPRGGFWIGFTGGLTAFLLMAWMMHISYPLIIGGKPTLPLPSLVPPTFEMTVLTSAYGMGIIMFVISRLIPMMRTHPVHPDVTSHVFALLVDENAPQEVVESIVRKSGGEVRLIHVPEKAIISWKRRKTSEE